MEDAEELFGPMDQGMIMSIVNVGLFLTFVGYGNDWAKSPH